MTVCKHKRTFNRIDASENAPGSRESVLKEISKPLPQRKQRLGKWISSNTMIERFRYNIDVVILIQNLFFYQDTGAHEIDVGDLSGQGDGDQNRKTSR